VTHQDPYLTPPELRRLTGKTYAPAQQRVLKKRSIRFIPDDAGRPVVLRAAVEGMLLGEHQVKASGRAPDFSAFPSVG
jgi:hypothetical protein